MPQTLRGRAAAAAAAHSKDGQCSSGTGNTNQVFDAKCREMIIQGNNKILFYFIQNKVIGHMTQTFLNASHC